MLIDEYGSFGADVDTEYPSHCKDTEPSQPDSGQFRHLACRSSDDRTVPGGVDEGVGRGPVGKSGFRRLGVVVDLLEFVRAADTFCLERTVILL